MSDDGDERDLTPRLRKPLRLAVAVRRPTHSSGVPIQPDSDEEWTQPRDLFDDERYQRRHGDSVQELTAEVRRGDLAEQLAKLAITVAANSQRDRSAIKMQGDQLARFLAVQPGGAAFAALDTRVDELSEDVKEIDAKLEKSKESQETLRREVQPAIAAERTGSRLAWMAVAGISTAVALVAWASRTVTQLEDQSMTLKETVTTLTHKLDEVERRQHGDLR